MSIRHPDVARILSEDEGYARLYHFDPIWRAWIVQFDKIVVDVERACQDERVEPTATERIVARLIDRALPVTRPDHAQMSALLSTPLKEIP